MPHGATSDVPLCLVCKSRSSQPPSKVGWISVGGEALGVVCGPCDDSDDAELEARILAKVSAAAPIAPAPPKVDISQPLMAAAGQAPPTWAARAAAKWAEPLTRPPAA
jgi:hypothetical protein